MMKEMRILSRFSIKVSFCFMSCFSDAFVRTILFLVPNLSLVRLIVVKVSIKTKIKELKYKKSRD